MSAQTKDSNPQPTTDSDIVEQDAQTEDKDTRDTDATGEENTSATSQPTANSEIEALQAQIAELENKLSQERNSKLMAMADLQNYRKHMEEQKAKFGAMANMQLVMQILEISDDIQLALQDQDLSLDRASEMLKIAQDKLNTALQIAGLEKISVNVGDEFQPATMEAITTTKVTETDQHNKVIAVISGGYKYRGQDAIVKSAKVVVGKHN